MIAVAFLIAMGVAVFVLGYWPNAPWFIAAAVAFVLAAIAL